MSSERRVGKIHAAAVFLTAGLFALAITIISLEGTGPGALIE